MERKESASFFTTVERRRSVRKFRPTAVSEDDLKCILTAANNAPSAGNLQAYEIYLVTDAKQKDALARAAHEQKCLTQVPVVLVFCANSVQSASRFGARGESLYAVQDATIATTYAQLAATALGLSTVWVGAFEEAAVSDILELPKTFRPVAMLPVGYADETPPQTARRTLEDLVHSA